MNKPAFPQLVPTPDEFAHGMTLRDYFAAKAMQGIFDSAIEWFPTDQKADEESLKLFKDIAQDSYAMADAMLKERENGNP
jgi:hypothetical protein